MMLDTDKRLTMLKKIFLVTCAMAMALSCSAKMKKSNKHKKPIQVYTQRYVLMDYNSGMILDSKDMDERVAPSSMTKLVTIYILFSKLQSGELKLTDKMTVSHQASHTGGSRSWIAEGSEVSVEDLIQSIIVHSGNDAAVVIAENISGSVERFADLMNETARHLGMNNSNFVNPAGLPEDGHYSTVHDLAIVAKRLIQDFPEYYSYFSQKEFEFNGIRQSNRNTLLWDNIGVDGLKTGHTEKGGYGLAASAYQDGVRLISVVNGYSTPNSRSTKTKELLTRGFRSITTCCLAKKGVPVCNVDVWLGSKPAIPLICNQDIHITLPKSELKNLKAQVFIKSPIKAPIKIGTQVGYLVSEYGNGIKLQYDLYAGDNVEELGAFSRCVAALKYMLFGRSACK